MDWIVAIIVAVAAAALGVVISSRKLLFYVHKNHSVRLVLPNQPQRFGTIPFPAQSVVNGKINDVRNVLPIE